MDRSTLVYRWFIRCVLVSKAFTPCFFSLVLATCGQRISSASEHVRFCTHICAARGLTFVLTYQAVHHWQANSLRGLSNRRYVTRWCYQAFRPTRNRNYFHCTELQPDVNTLETTARCTGFSLKLTDCWQIFGLRLSCVRSVKQSMTTI